MNFSALLLEWYDQNKRALPWRNTKEAYAIWISEIMLQQTRVANVKEYYRRFLERFPNIQALANAPQEEVLKAWEGLGYYSRARNLQKAAQQILQNHNGCFPEDYQQIRSLPGIGPYTAGAIASIAFSKAIPAIDGNVKRVSARIFGIRQNIDTPAAYQCMESRLRELMAPDRPGDFNQAMIELGATLCSPVNPGCHACPLQSLCDAFAKGDMKLLPVHVKKPEPIPIALSVCLLFWRDKVLLFRRNEAMLKGMYVFFLVENENKPEKLEEQLAQEGMPAKLIARHGHARHVFTHRVWEMEIMQFELLSPPDEAFLSSHNALLASIGSLDSYPIPTAMRAAKKKAVFILKEGF